MSDQNVNNEKTQHSTGMSFFNTSLRFGQRQQEDDDEDLEDLEDQKRREEELQNLIANAFEDIAYEDDVFDSSCERSLSSVRHKSTYEPDSAAEHHDSEYTEPQIEELYRNASLNSMEQLEVLYEARVREVKSMNIELENTKEAMKQQHDTLQKKILLLEADKDRITLSLNQTQSLLVDKNQEICDCNKEIENLKQEIDNLKDSKSKLEEELLFYKQNSDELEQKLHLLEKGLETKVSEKQIRARYEQELKDLQDTLETCNKKLEKTERECKKLQQIVKEVEHSKEVLTAEKAEVINSISNSLEDSQAQRSKLLNKISSLEIEKQALHQQIAVLKNTISVTEVKPSSSSTCSENQGEVITTLRAELRRSLEEHKENRNHILKLEAVIKEQRHKELALQEEVRSRQALLESEQVKSLEDRTMLKQQNQELQKAIKHLQACMNQNYVQRTEENSDLLRENASLKQINIELQQTLSAIQTSMNQNNVKDNEELIQAYEHLKKHNIELQNTIRQLQNATNQYVAQGTEQGQVKASTSGASYHEELDGLLSDLQLLEQGQEVGDVSWKNRYIESEGERIKLQETVARLNSKLAITQLKVNTLKSKQALREERDILIEEMKGKAAMFEDYMSSKASSSSSSKEDKAVSTEDLPDTRIERTEVDGIVSTVQEQVKTKFLQLLDQKVAEVETNLLDKEQQIQLMVGENKSLREKLKFDREAFKELTDVWDYENKRLAALVRSLGDQNTELTESVRSLRIKDKQHVAQYEQITSKLTETKNYIAVIKKISEKQEQHLKSEYDRIASKFHDVLLVIQGRVSQHLIQTNEQLKQETEEIEALYQAKIREAKKKNK